MNVVWSDRNRRIGLLTDSTDASNPVGTVEVRVVAARETATARTPCETEFPSNPIRGR